MTTWTPPAVADDPDLDAFKQDVRTWIELDDSIRRLQAALRERRTARTQLSVRVLQFMSRHNIEDLSTRDTRIRYKVQYVRKPLTQDVIKQRIDTYFGDNKDSAVALHGALFANRERVEKSSLRRLGGAPGATQ